MILVVGAELIDGKNNIMTKKDFLKLMQYPAEWLEWDMYPDDLFKGQFDMYKIGDEKGSEHDRNGAFHWWLKKDLNNEKLKKIALLTYLDPDQIMAADVRKYISNRNGLSSDIMDILGAK